MIEEVSVEPVSLAYFKFPPQGGGVDPKVIDSC